MGEQGTGQGRDVSPMLVPVAVVNANETVAQVRCRCPAIVSVSVVVADLLRRRGDFILRRE